ncbi:hypothetical protein GDO86_016445 [Hymenochirus boettgeri]|uniref:G-protein coupled receptors family 1 profile domain-containing protein n=1 Tax=Hymenochirus boettgeri TaxID=247094 RepID=A0A8T2JX16_9PIPI|nr:hypothetical protein GDO86_016445 [Hymenochirus boettgeri]
MDEVNRTVLYEFILLAFSDLHNYQSLLFIVILLMYIASLPWMFTQLYIFNALGETECYLLAIIAFDRHLAINHPLRYTSIMNNRFCTELAVLPWIIGFASSFIPTTVTAGLKFCGPNEINHFFCDLAPLQNLSCSNPFVSSIVTMALAIVMLVIPFMAIIGFYILIILTVSKITTTEGKYKAFSTCSSHLIVASRVYGTCIIVYLRPKGSQYDKFLALCTPLSIPC